MRITVIGTLISVTGYGLAITGGWVLYKNAAPETGIGRLPTLKGSQVAAEFFKKQDQQIQQRRWGNDVGFALLTFGSSLQLVGTLISGLAT